MPNLGDIDLSPLSFQGWWGLDFIGFKFPPYRPGNPDDLQSTVKDLFHNQIHMASQTHTHSIWAVQNGYTNVLSSRPYILQAADNRAPLATS